MTKNELVGVDDALADIVWSGLFIEAQGYKLDPTTIYQDNKSAILLETKGKFSSSKRTKHIKARFFRVQNRVEDRELRVQHYTAEEIWANMLTKPKQGAAFARDRATLMNCQENYLEDPSFDWEDTDEGKPGDAFH